MFKLFPTILSSFTYFVSFLTLYKAKMSAFYEKMKEKFKKDAEIHPHLFMTLLRYSD
jgi:hypothetical protein